MEQGYRCEWTGEDPVYIAYHDEEWGRPVHEDRRLFEMLVLEGMQAGLSWITVLKKREAFRAAFDGFDPEKVALYDEEKVEKLMADKGIIRHRGKIHGAIHNAKLFLEVQKKYGSFDRFIWSYVDDMPIINHPESIADLPAATPLSDRISKDLKKMGFQFVGSTTIYAFMQAIGMVDDHIAGCHCRRERLQKQLDFSLEIDKEKNIFRQTHLSGHGRSENDAEHAWHMAIMAYLLREYANEPVDIGKVMLMCLIHDIVEIDAGDTYAYDTENLKTQKAREDAAKERIFSLLPEDQKAELTALFDEFEEAQTSEARFARAMDNLQPLLLNNSNGGGDWKAHGVTAKQVYRRQERTKLGSERLYEVTDQILRENIRKGNLMEE